LNRNLREEHGYTYGARSAFRQRANQHELLAWSSVQSEVTAAALGEFRREFQGLASGDVTADELAKAVRTVRYDLVGTAETTGSLAGTLTELAANGRPLDAIAVALANLERVDLAAVNSSPAPGSMTGARCWSCWSATPPRSPDSSRGRFPASPAGGRSRRSVGACWA